MSEVVLVSSSSSRSGSGGRCSSACRQAKALGVAVSDCTPARPKTAHAHLLPMPQVPGVAQVAQARCVCTLWAALLCLLSVLPPTLCQAVSPEASSCRCLSRQLYRQLLPRLNPAPQSAAPRPDPQTCRHVVRAGNFSSSAGSDRHPGLRLHQSAAPTCTSLHCQQPHLPASRRAARVQSGWYLHLQRRCS
jgi:hypothetical protein